MRKDGTGLDDVIGDGIGRLPMDGRCLQGLDCVVLSYLDLWGTEPDDIKTMESNSDE